MVEWKKLGEACEIIRGKRVTKGDLIDNGKFPVISGGVTPMGYIDSYNREPNTITVSQYGTAGYVDFQQSRFWANDICYCVYPEKPLDNKYLWYVLKSKQDLLYAIRNTDAIPYSLPVDSLKSVSIPIPSLEEQTRIVGILDTFTSSIDNLKEQIAQRRKQYEYYRDQLLDLEGKPGVEMKTLGEVFNTRNGYTPSTSNEQFWKDGIIPWFKMEDIRDNGRILSDSYLHITPQAVKGKGLFKANSIILATSATIGEHALVLVDFLCNQRFTNLSLKENYSQSVDMKYVYYYMFIVDEWCKQHVNQGGFASVDMTGLYNLSIPLPPLQEQQRIVSILDTFEASIRNLEQQLAQREKQYEYYRNRLLSFEEAARG